LKEAFVPVLLLAQGDPQSKDMLRRAIEARYGLRPPALESLRIDFKGRARAKIGPINSWVPVEATARFHFPNAMRWDFRVRAAGVQIGSGMEAFDGMTFRSGRGNKGTTEFPNPEIIHSTQCRLWAIAAVLLTPLGEHFVKVSAQGSHTLQVTNTQVNSTILLHLNEDNTLDYVEVDCLNPETQNQQNFTLSVSKEQGLVGDLMLPCKVSSFWDGEPYFEVQPVAAETNPTISQSVFALLEN
jgi:hypothetical protein